jgi:putative DNA primase/helicase
VNVETIAKALGGRKAGGGWGARCPAHDDREPSLSIRQADGGKVLVHCHAGCDQSDVITALRSRHVWNNDDRRHGPRGHKSNHSANDPDEDTRKRIEAALALWRATHIWPAMVALVTRGVDDTPIAIHRPFLARDGAGKAPVDPPESASLNARLRGPLWRRRADERARS